ncbi:MAG: DNA mismatch repair protein MutS, partial [Oscillospiraceae bacterium]
SEAYISRLIKKGYKVAICEQTEDPKLAKSLVKRDVIRIVTPGTVIEDQMLEEGANNYICCVFIGEKNVGISTADISTGRVSVTSLDKYDRVGVKNEVLRFSPSELVVSENSVDRDFFTEENFGCCVTFFRAWGFAPENAETLAKKQFPQDFEQFNDEEHGALISSMGGLLSYLFETQKIGVERLVSLEVYESFNFMHLDETARRNLEITKTMRTGDKKGSLLWVMDKTQTAMGKRLLRKFLERPLTNPIAIEKRLNAVEELFDGNTLRMDLREQLSSIFDMERLLTRIICGTTNPRELVTLKLTSMRLPQIKDGLSGVSSYILKDIREKIDTLEDICKIIDVTISDDPPALIKDGGYIKEGFSEKLDALRE